MTLSRRTRKQQVRQHFWRKIILVCALATIPAGCVLAWLTCGVLAATVLAVSGIFSLLQLRTLMRPGSEPKWPFWRATLSVILVLPLLAYAAREQEYQSPSPAGSFYITVFPAISATPPAAVHQSGAAKMGMEPTLSAGSTYTADNAALYHYNNGTDNAVQQHKVVAVRNGQILVLANQQEVRLIGVDVPEEYQADAERVLTAAMVGRYVALEICPVRPYDQYGRLRAVVYANGRNLNTALIALGYSKVQVKADCHVHYTDWLVYERAAASQKRGLWRNNY